MCIFLSCFILEIVYYDCNNDLWLFVNLLFFVCLFSIRIFLEEFLMWFNRIIDVLMLMFC